MDNGRTIKEMGKGLINFRMEENMKENGKMGKPFREI